MFLFFYRNKDSYVFFFFFSSRRRHTRYWRDWSSDVCSSDLAALAPTDWTGMDQHIQALGGTPGYGAGVGQVLDQMMSVGTPKVPVADIATLQQTMVKQGFLLPGQATGTWDANS